MGKLKIRQYVIGSVIAIAISVVSATFYFESPRPSVANVLSVDPIKSSVAVRQYYCHIRVLPIPITVGKIEGDRFNGHEYRILTLLDSLNVKMEYPALNHSALKNCIIVDFKKPCIVGYDVSYVIGEEPGKVRMLYKPEETIPLNEKGQLIIKQHSEPCFSSAF
ncbi:UmoD family flagellar biogenesis regulator [Xenorhabdus hominickii]|uniref:UmoD n=1 Tax=Xenorhabdus hominickii TaxID=351679 RepID=A0A2G0Q1D3_XENHO|nr:UmoD family flagellar biogenesis regulator [Xenorhabdus hominickii]AOM40456.1 UmoD [Xenorhabdus hominickii]PHM53028.1 UmoD [Xenorhabdus hominickii]